VRALKSHLSHDNTSIECEYCSFVSYPDFCLFSSPEEKKEQKSFVAMTYHSVFVLDECEPPSVNRAQDTFYDIWYLHC
jgi:hypothetical protein